MVHKLHELCCSRLHVPAAAHIIGKMRTTNAPRKIPSDPVEVAWWAAEVIPIGDHERYEILSFDSAYDRLLWVAGHLKQLIENNLGQQMTDAEMGLVNVTGLGTSEEDSVIHAMAGRFPKLECDVD